MPELFSTRKEVQVLPPLGLLEDGPIRGRMRRLGYTSGSMEQHLNIRTHNKGQRLHLMRRLSRPWLEEEARLTGPGPKRRL